jgi:SAM-dependent methyltransferase
MAHPDARRWNRRYEEEGPQRVHRPPNPLLVAARPHLPARGLALDAACGLGVNCRYLASLGLSVIGLDISLVALQIGRQAARERGLHFAAAVVDLEKLWLPPEHFDLIVNFRYLERSTFPLYDRALKPGGLLVFETFLYMQETAEESDNPEHYLQPGELRSAFPGYEVLQSGTRLQHNRTLENLVARKPG